MAVIGLKQGSAVFYFILPFPFAPLLAPFFGLLGVINIFCEVEKSNDWIVVQVGLKKDIVLWSI